MIEEVFLKLKFYFILFYFKLILKIQKWIGSCILWQDGEISKFLTRSDLIQ
jgi:hypothetical protein